MNAVDTNVREYVHAGESFGFKTTLSGQTYARQIPDWRKSGYWVGLYFLWLPRVEIAIDRVARRVAQGGHSVPEDVIRRRFDAGLRNLEDLYKPLVDSWAVYDNSGRFPREIDASSEP